MKYIDTYLKTHGYSIQDLVFCENCADVAVDVHHIRYKSLGGTDNFENLIGLCRKCHAMAHDGDLSADVLRSKKIYPNKES